MAAGVLAALLLTGAGAPDCAALRQHPLPGGQVVSAMLKDGVCHVEAQLRPAPGSRIGLSLRLPASGWSGRYVQLGTGGFAGTIPEAGLAHETARGNAAAVTDTGHVAAHGFDASWAAGHPERVVDYGYRSIKVSSDAGRALTQAFYGRPPSARYFVGCSNGGRQGLIAAQRYPADWDGVLAGAPALHWSTQLSRFGEIQKALRARQGALIPVAKLPAIQAAAARHCPSGGARTCAGLPRLLACRGPETRACLTPAEAGALAQIIRDFQADGAAIPGGWDRWIVNPDRAAQTQLSFAEQFFGHMVLNRPDWRVEQLRPADLRRAAQLAPILNAEGDLSAFRRRGGKLIVYAGWADPVISPRAIRAYHRRAGGPAFSRLYMLPGMLHCQGGAGADSFGQSWVSTALGSTPRHDIRAALEGWVEQGIAPGEIEAARYVDGDPRKGIAVRAVIRPE